jgi:hypothetical protein
MGWGWFTSICALVFDDKTQNPDLTFPVLAQKAALCGHLCGPLRTSIEGSVVS